MRRLSVIALTVPMMFAAAALAQATKPAEPAQPSAGLFVTRVDVWQALQQFERAHCAHPPKSDDDRARINKHFDAIVEMIVQRKLGPAVRELHALTDSITSNTKDRVPQSAAARVARALRVRIGPSVSVPKRPTAIRARVALLYPVELTEPVTLKLVLAPTDAPDKILREREFKVETNGLAPTLIFPQPTDVPVGRYRVDVVAPDGFRVNVATWTLAEESMDLRREYFQRWLVRARLGSDEVSHAIAAVAARSSLLADNPGETEVVRYSTNPLQLSDELRQELQALQEDRDPFANRAGDYWRTVFLGDMQAPARVYAPQAVIDAGRPAPLVIAVSGEAFDEGMFLDGYGCGTLKRLADEYGFIVVSPQFEVSRVAQESVSSIVRAMSFNYSIDEKRVFAIGHSVGALVVQKWAAQYRDELAGVVLFAGAQPFNVQAPFPRTRLVAGDLDALFPIDRARSIVADARGRRLSVDLHEIRGAGHNLLVGDGLADAIAWLMPKRGAAPSTAPATPPGTAPATAPAVNK